MNQTQCGAQIKSPIFKTCCSVCACVYVHACACVRVCVCVRWEGLTCQLCHRAALCHVFPVQCLQHLGAAEPLEAAFDVHVEPLQRLDLQQPIRETHGDQQPGGPTRRRMVDGDKGESIGEGGGLCLITKDLLVRKPLHDT